MSKTKWNGYSNPTESDTYIVAWVFQHKECPYPHFYAVADWDAEEKEWESINDEPIDILAWMPLPDFYKEDEDE